MSLLRETSVIRGSFNCHNKWHRRQRRRRRFSWTASSLDIRERAGSAFFGDLGECIKSQSVCAQWARATDGSAACRARHSAPIDRSSSRPTRSDPRRATQHPANEKFMANTRLDVVLITRHTISPQSADREKKQKRGERDRAVSV